MIVEEVLPCLGVVCLGGFISFVFKYLERQLSWHLGQVHCNLWTWVHWDAWKLRQTRQKKAIGRLVGQRILDISIISILWLSLTPSLRMILKSSHRCQTYCTALFHALHACIHIYICVCVSSIWRLIMTLHRIVPRPNMWAFQLGNGLVPDGCCQIGSTILYPFVDSVLPCPLNLLPAAPPPTTHQALLSKAWDSTPKVVPVVFQFHWSSPGTLISMSP